MFLLAMIVAATLLLLVTQWVRFELVALGVIAVLGLSGLLEPQEALSGLSHPATITVAAMLVLSAGLERTGVVDYIGGALARRARGRVTRLLLIIALPTALFSAFMNNTAIIALMIPVVLTLSRRTKLSPSKLVDSDQLPVDSRRHVHPDRYQHQHSRRLALPPGRRARFRHVRVHPPRPDLPAGGRRVLGIPGAAAAARAHVTGAADGRRGCRPVVTEVTVPERSRLVGLGLGEAFGDAAEVRVLELIRDEEVTLGPAPEIKVRAGDVLLIEGTARRIHEMIGKRRVVQGTAVSDADRVPISRIDLHIVEAVVAPNSRFLHRRVRDLGLQRPRLRGARSASD